jgi:hypothetical protein
MQTVDVLGHEQAEAAAPFEAHEAPVASVGLGRVLGAREQAAPRGLAHHWVARVDLGARGLFGRRIERPHPARSAVVGDAGGRGDAGTREDEDSRAIGAAPRGHS